MSPSMPEPSDLPAGGADVYVVFGAPVRPGGEPSGTLRRRVEGAIAASRGSAEPLFVVTGAVGRHPPSEAEVMQRLLIEGGVEAERIVLEPTATDTLSSVFTCAAMLRGPLPARRVFVCTSRYHLRRCVILFRVLGIEAEGVPMPRERPHLPLWRLCAYQAKELLATPYDVALAGIRRLVGA